LPDVLATETRSIRAELATLRSLVAAPTALPDELVQLPSALRAALAEHRRELHRENANTVETALARLREVLGHENEQLADGNEVLLRELGSLREQVERVAAARELPERLVGLPDVLATEAGGLHAELATLRELVSRPPI